MWDKMVIVIVIKKNKKMMTTSETPQIDVEGCLVIKAPKKRKKGGDNRGRKEKMIIDNLVMKNVKHVDESMRIKFSNCFPLGNKLVERVKVHVDRFTTRNLVICN